MPKPRFIFIIDKDVSMGTCSACAAIFRVEGDSKGIKRKLEKKFAKHVSDKHPGEDFSQAAMIAGDVAKDQPANADIGLKLPMVSVKFHDGSRLLSHRTRRACPTVPCGKR